LRQAGLANPKVEGRRSHAEARPEVVAEAKRLRRASPKTGERRSFREIAKQLASMGHLNERGQPYNAASIKAMIDGPMPTVPKALPGEFKNLK
jgi:hypothetical protein